MRCNHVLGVLIAGGLTVFLIGCLKSKGNRKAEPETRSEPVLKVDDDAATIIRKAVAAHGGEAAFSRWSCGYLKYKTKGGAVPDQLGEVTMEDTFQLPGHFKRITRTKVEGKELVIVYVINHGKCWTKRGDKPAELEENDFTEKTEHTLAGFCNLAPLKEDDLRATGLGALTIEDRDAVGIRVQSERLGEREFYFELQTGLLLKSRKSLAQMDSDKPAVMESFLSDYKDVQGTKVPMRIKGSNNGSPILDVTLLEVKFAESFPEGTFFRP